MVKLLNLDEDADPEAVRLLLQHPNSAIGSEFRPDPNLNKVTAAFNCYPVVSLLATYLDLNTLDSLARTCRQVRAGLLQYRQVLMTRALRCENETANPAQRLGNALHASLDMWTAYGRNGDKIGRITSGKLGPCVRDMVGECRKCGYIICRNCTIKPPPTTLLKLRHRRLCRTCMKAPFDKLTTISRTVEEDGTRRVCPAMKACGIVLTFCSTEEYAPEIRSFYRSSCTCNDIVWICQPCGQSMRTDDTTYMRGWKWRTRYSHCGGIGAGLGEGNEGVECGRTRDCVAARMVEKDVECCAAELAAMEVETAKAEIDGRHWNGSSYSTQEIVGIGGKVKTKVKKRVPVGAIVKEYEDERDGEYGDKFLVREQSGANRSWCSWCSRVVASKKDIDGAALSSLSLVSTNSSGSTQA